MGLEFKFAGIDAGVAWAAAWIAAMAVLLALTRRGSLKARNLLLYLAALTTVAYLAWRATSTLVLGSLLGIPSLVLLVAEILAFLQSCLLYALSARPYRRPRPEWPAHRPRPTLDLFVPTFNEPVPVLRRTLSACGRLLYAAGRLHIWVLDDGGRPEVRVLADRFGLRYIARAEHGHAKAGNLNHALERTSGELVAVLDADMVPRPEMLLDMTGYFAEDPKLAFVQAPQTFFNPDPFQHNLGLHGLIPNEQSFFMRDVLASRDRVNAVMCVGTNVVFRRSALAAVGGFATQSVTEDMETGMLLHAAGFHSAYHDGEVAAGLAPESMEEMIAQRTRWCRGNIQACRAHNPVTLRGLTLWQRAAYVSGLLYWYFGLQQLVYLLAPVLFLLFGVQSLHAAPWALVAFWLPAAAGANLAFSALGMRRGSMFWSRIIELAQAPPLGIAALRQTLGLRGPGFRVTRKGLSSKHASVSQACFHHLAVALGVDLLALGVGIRETLAAGSAGVRFGIEINLLWAAINGVALALALMAAVDQSRPRSAERFPIEEPVRVRIGGRTINGQTFDVSETGARIAVDQWSPVPAKDTPCRVVLPRLYLGLNATVTSARTTGERTELAVAFAPVPDRDFGRLVGLLFDRSDASRDDGYRVGRLAAVRCIVAWELRSLRREWAKKPLRRVRVHPPTVASKPEPRQHDAAL